MTLATHTPFVPQGVPPARGLDPGRAPFVPQGVPPARDLNPGRVEIAHKVRISL